MRLCAADSLLASKIYVTDPPELRRLRGHNGFRRRSTDIQCIFNRTHTAPPTYHLTDICSQAPERVAQSKILMPQITPQTPRPTTNCRHGGFAQIAPSLSAESVAHRPAPSRQIISHVMDGMETPTIMLHFLRSKLSLIEALGTLHAASFALFVVRL